VRKGRSQLTPLELQIMKALWEGGPSTVQAVQQKLSGERLAYTTVQTMLNILHRKGRVRRRLVGKAYEYRAVLSRDRAIREALADMLNRIFGGSVDTLLMTLVKSRQIDADKLAKLQRLIEDRQAPGEVKHERG
jgi:predicted transcriptional regulator